MPPLRTLALAAVVLTTGAALASTGSASAQSSARSLKIGLNPATLDSSAALELDFPNKGFLPTALTSTQRDAIGSPATGLLLYNTTLQCLQLNSGTDTAPVWECVTGGGATNNSAILAEVLEGSASPGGASNANGRALTAGQLNQVATTGGATAARQDAYNTAIRSTTTFSNPVTAAQVQGLIDAVNAANP